MHLNTKWKNALEYSLKKRDPKENKKEKYIDFIDKSLNESQKMLLEMQ